MESQTRQTKLAELERLRTRVAELEREVDQPPAHGFSASDYYTAYYATTGFMLGILGASVSLLFNVVGSLVIDQQPLRLIQIYLTFPLGEQALSPEFGSGLALAIGVCLYLATGMLLGIPFQLVLARFAPNSLFKRLVLATVLGLVVWVISYYGILSWLQPLLFGGRWIVDMVPIYVAAATHVVFGWTMALVYPLGAYVPFKLQTER